MATRRTTFRRIGISLLMLVSGLGIGTVGGGILGALFGTLVAFIFGTVVGAITGATVGAGVGLVNGAICALVTILFFDPLWDGYEYFVWVMVGTLPVTFFSALVGFAVARTGWNELAVAQMLQFNWFVHVPAAIGSIFAPAIGAWPVMWYINRAPEIALDTAAMRRRKRWLATFAVIAVSSIVSWLGWQHSLLFYRGMPGDELIVFEQHHGGEAFLGRIAPDATYQARLTYHFDTSLFNFTLGQRQLQRGIHNQGIAYLSDHDRGLDTSRQDQLYTLRLDGSAEQALKTWDLNPGVLSPDGVTMVLATTLTVTPTSTSYSDSEHVVVRTVNGSAEWCLTCATAGDLAHDFAWSPDGTQIAFAMRTGVRTHVFTAARDGHVIKQVTNSAIQDSFQPDWSPDGMRLAVTVVANQRSAVAVIDLTTGVSVTLPGAGSDSDPSWSADGTQLAFVSARDGPRTQQLKKMTIAWHHIYCMNADGSHQRRLTSGLDDYTNPVWVHVAGQE